MTKFKIKSLTLAVAAVCSSGAFAGSIPTPATTTKYAVESLLSTTDLTLPVLTYRMGVDRTIAQDFTVIITPSAGNTFTVASCTAALPVVVLAGGAAGAATPTVKRASASECAYEIDVTTAFVRGAGTIDLAFTGLVLDSHTLATAGNTVALSVALKDLGETAFIDNSGALSVNVATSGNALTMTAVQDTNTQADVNDEVGPLFGFVTNAVAPSDADAIARARFVIRNNNDGAFTWLRPDGATPWDFAVDGTDIDMTVTGNWQGLLAGGFTVAPPVGPVPATTVGATSATFTIVPANIVGGAGTNHNFDVTFTSARTASLGTARTFGISGVGDVITGADVALAGNSSWWVWGANASQLMTPWFTNYASYQSRFFLLNRGTLAVTYSATCFAETGNVITYGPAQSGTLVVGLNAITSTDVCTFSGNTRGAVIFTINAPIETIKGSYQAVNPASLNLDITPLVRPYTQGATTE